VSSHGLHNTFGLGIDSRTAKKVRKRRE